jgi:hypothetical protein
MFDVGHESGLEGAGTGGGNGAGEVGTRAGPGAEAVIHAVAVLTLILRAFEENTGAGRSAGVGTEGAGRVVRGVN